MSPWLALDSGMHFESFQALQIGLNPITLPIESPITDERSESKKTG